MTARRAAVLIVALALVAALVIVVVSIWGHYDLYRFTVTPYPGTPLPI